LKVWSVCCCWGRNRIDGVNRIETAQAKVSRTVKVNDNEEVRLAA